MAFIQPDPCTTADPLDPHVQAVYDRQTRAFGYLPNYAPLFSHRPEVIDLWAELQRGLQRHVTPRLFELVTFAAALALKSSYCSLAHGSKLREFLCDAEIKSLAGGDYEAVVPEREAAAMRYGAQVAADATGVTKPQIERMRAAGYTDAEIFDVAGIAAGRAFFSKLVEGLGAQPDCAYLALPESIRGALQVGRAIALQETASPLQSV
jgi:alkylhydroperoxidase family enzyme